MSKLDDIRKQYPGAYDDLSDAEFANALYSKSYSDMDRTEFDTLIGTAKGAEPGVLQQLFDVKNSDTGESYLYGNTPAPTQFEDLQRTVGDTASRGYLDKLRGPEAQAKTAAARERMPDWVETPMDIATAVGTSPYRIGSMGAGAVAGGLEGAASAYGHQEGWVPGWDVLKGAGIGAVAGAGGAKVGEWLGGGKATREAEAARPYKTDVELQDAAFAQGSDDLLARAANVEKIRAAQGSPRDSFAKMMSGMSPEVQAKAAEIAGGKGMTRAAGAMADKTGKNLSIPLLVGEMAATGGIPYKTLAGMAVKHAVSKAGKTAGKVSDEEIAALADLERSGPLFVDPATIDKWRDAVAKIGIGYGKAP